MTPKLRLLDVKPHDYLNPDAQINAQIELFDADTGRTLAQGNLVYSGAGLAGLTQAQVQAQLRTDALAWAAQVKAAYQASPDVAKNVALIGRLSALIGAEIAVP